MAKRNVPVGGGLFTPQGIKTLLGFERDANTMLVGPTNSGKTELLKTIISTATFVGGVPNKIFVLCPRETIKSWEDFKENKYGAIELLTDLDNFLAHADECPENSIVVFDDYMSALDDTARRRSLEKWMFVTTHHRHLWTFFVTHDMFHKQMTTIRRNTQNYILFNVQLNDARSSQDFIQRVLGTASSALFLEFWNYAVESTKGWIRMDQKIHTSAKLKTVLSMGGVTSDTAWLCARSESLEDPLYLDAVKNVSIANNPLYQIPESLVKRDGSSGGPSDSVPSDGASDMQQSDGSGIVPEQYER